MFTVGKIVYSLNPRKVIVELDQRIADYYFSLIPKYKRVNKQRFSAHISVVRNEEIFQNWEMYHGLECVVEYDSEIFNDETYYWLNVYGDILERIRLSLGLEETSEVTRSPDGKQRFHMTIGNVKIKQ